jgi:hypothetical protein
MRSKISICLIIFFGLLLTGCGTNSSDSSDYSAQGSASPAEENSRETPLALKLALGTFKLDKTDQAITPEQAKELLPLWKAASVLSNSETAANQELQALVNQIQRTMTPEQLKAIEDMKLSFRDMGSIAEELGLDFGSGGFGNMSPEMQATMQAARESGGGPPEGFGGGPGGFPEGGFDPQAQETSVGSRVGTGLGLPSSLMDAVINFLEAKVQ